MNEQKIPVLFTQKEACCGCGACEAICPASAITMELDEDGFYYPKVHPMRCIGCGSCVRACANQ